MLASRHKNSAYIIQFARWQQPLRDLATSSTTDTGNSGVSDTEHTDSNPALQGFRRGALQPRIVGFQYSVDQAKQAFRQWHAQRWLAPTKLLEVPGSSIRPVLLPFWLFEVSVHVQHSATLGFAAEGQPDGTMHWTQSGQYSRHREYPWNLASMQIYASYKWRRDFIDGIKSAGSLTRTRALKVGEATTLSALAGKGQDSVVDLDPPTMRQSVAWELALRTIRMKEVASAEETLKATSNADVVRDIKISVRANRRRARILYLPAYIVDYTYGEYVTSAGERKPHKYMAVVSGIGDCQVMGDRHFNPRKAQALTAAVMGASTLAVGALATVAVEGASVASTLSIEHGFWVFMACITSGLAAKLAPYALQRRLEEARLAADEADLEKLHGAGLGPLDVGDEENLWTSSNREWRRWEESDLWRWDERKRREWAIAIVRSSHSRALQRRRAIARQSQQNERQQAEADREARRRERFGDRSSHFQRMGGEAPIYGSNRAASWDVQGFYKLLGLPTHRSSESGAQVSDRDVKRAFRHAALRWHPDRLDSLPPADRATAHQRFQELSRAYEVLGDPERRRQYDSGQPVMD